MPLDSAGLPQTPTDLASLGRRLVQLERLVQLGGGARTLVKASVGRGGIRVTAGGSIAVEDGGSVVIETGNLVLGDGMIEGSALKNQIEASAAQGSSSGRGLTNSFTSYASASIRTPGWASVAIVQAFAVGRNRLTSTDANLFTIRGRLNLAGQASAENITPSTTTGDNGVAENFHNLSWDRLITAPPATLTVEYQLRADDARAYGGHSSNRADVAAVAIFMRG